MKKLKIVTIPWEDMDKNKTEAMYIDVDRLYTVSEFITLLEEAKKKWGR